MAGLRSIPEQTVPAGFVIRKLGICGDLDVLGRVKQSKVWPILTNTQFRGAHIAWGTIGSGTYCVSMLTSWPCPGSWCPRCRCWPPGSSSPPPACSPSRTPWPRDLHISHNLKVHWHENFYLIDFDLFVAGRLYLIIRGKCHMRKKFNNWTNRVAVESLCIY